MQPSSWLVAHLRVVGIVAQIKDSLGYLGPAVPVQHCTVVETVAAVEVLQLEADPASPVAFPDVPKLAGLYSVASATVGVVRI